ncbi:MAG: GNAT family N-acetyltransferase [Pseudobdellovibrionaceae bacterium]
METKIEVQLRKAELWDLKRIAELSSQLGYENSTEDITNRFHEMKNSEDHIFIVAELVCSSANIIVGFVHLKKHISFFVEASLEVGGLIVDKNHRGQGIGRLLMMRAEEVAKDWKVTSVRLTSNIKRTEAHRFYLNLGYDQPKTSHLFIKKLAITEE